MSQNEDFGYIMLRCIYDNPGITQQELVIKLKSPRHKIYYYTRKYIGFNLIRRDPEILSGGKVSYYPTHHVIAFEVIDSLKKLRDHLKKKRIGCNVK